MSWGGNPNCPGPSPEALRRQGGIGRVLDSVKRAPIVGSRATQDKPETCANVLIRMPSTEIILTENVPGLGAEADVVKVRRGYARNFLLPQGKAFEVTKSSMRKLDMLKGKRAEREAKELNEAEELSRRIGKLKVTFTLETGETGKAFGSVTAQDIVKRLKNELGNEIDRHRVVLEHPLKTTGEHEVPIKLHADVTAKFVFQIKSSTEDAAKTEAGPEAGEKSRPTRKRSER